jgi:hypothetical protein
MTYNLRNYRHRNPKGGDDKKTNGPFFQAPQRSAVRRKKQGGFFQPKLAVGQPGDSYEKEADATASAVTKPSLATTGDGVQQKELPGVQRLATSKEDEKLGTNDARMEKDKEEPMKPVQKKEAPDKKKEKPVQKADDPKKEKKEKPVKKKEEPKKDMDKKVQKKGGGEEKKKKKTAQKAADPKKEKPVQKAKEPKKEKKDKPVQKADDPKKEKGKVQKKEGERESTTSEAVEEEIKRQSGKGSPLPPKVLAEMSKSFGVDLSNVRIHSDMAAVKLCRELNALAFTHGQDIYFNEGRFNPESTEGKMLLAHELTHVIQQANSIES